MQRAKKTLCLLLCLCLLWSLTACNGAKPEAQGCLELTDVPATTLDNVWYNPGGIFRCAVFDSLLLPDADMRTLHCALAESYTVSPDGRTFVFTLRDGVRWHDGEAFDAQDVLFSIQAVLRSSEVNGVIEAAFRYIEGAEAYSAGTSDQLPGVSADGRQVTIRLTGEMGHFLEAIAQLAILPEHLLGQVDPSLMPSHEYWKKPVGTGCYRIAEAVEGESFLLEANKDYFGVRPGIERIRILLNEKDCVTAMAEGRLDFYVTNDPEEISRLKGVEGLSEHRLNILFPAYLIMNLRSEGVMHQFLQDVRVRKALLLALDRQTITETLFPGSVVSDTMVPSWDSWYCTMAQAFPYDPEGARALLEEAGFDFSRTLRLRYSIKGQATADLMNAIAVYWRAIGIRVDVERFDGSGSEHMFNIRDFDVCYKRLSAFNHASIYEEVDGDGVMQQRLLRLPVYDALIDQLSVTMDEETRRNLVCQAQQLDQEHLLRLPLFSLANVAYVKEGRFQMPDAYGNLWYRYDLRFQDWRLKE